MKHKISSLSLLCALSAAPQFAHADTQLIPLPASLQVKNEKPFVLNSTTPIVAEGAAEQAVQVLAAQLRAATGFALPIKALRVVATTTQKTWTILRDPILR